MNGYCIGSYHSLLSDQMRSDPTFFSDIVFTERCQPRQVPYLIVLSLDFTTGFQLV